MLSKLKASFFVFGSFLLLCVVGSVNAHASTMKKSDSYNISNGTSVVNDKFVNKFDSAVSMKNNKFVIDYSKITSASGQEVRELKSLVNQSNSTLGKLYSVAPEDSVYKDKNSVTFFPIDNNQFTLEYRSGRNGKTFIHSYWWGYKIGISKKDLHKISMGLDAAAVVPYDKFLPIGWAVTMATGLAGIATGNATSGIVFNFSGGMVWGAKRQ